MKKNTHKLIEMEPGLWLDTQNCQVVFDSEWLRKNAHTRLGREPTAKEWEHMLAACRTITAQTIASGAA